MDNKLFEIATKLGNAAVSGHNLLEFKASLPKNIQTFIASLESEGDEDAAIILLAQLESYGYAVQFKLGEGVADLTVQDYKLSDIQYYLRVLVTSKKAYGTSKVSSHYIDDAAKALMAVLAGRNW